MKKIKLIKYKKGFLYFCSFVILLIIAIPTYLIVYPGIMYTNYNNKIIINNKPYKIHIKNIKGNIFNGLEIKGFYLKDYKNNLIEKCNSIYFKPDILSFIDNNKELKINTLKMNCQFYKTYSKITSGNFIDNIKNNIKKIKFPVKIQNLDLKIKELKFNFTSMKNVKIKGKNIDLDKNEYNLKIEFDYFNKYYTINVN